MSQQGGAEGGEGPSEEGGSEGPGGEEGPSGGPSEEGGYSPDDDSQSGPPEESYRQETPNYGPPPGYSPRDEPQSNNGYHYRDEITHAQEPSNRYKSGSGYGYYRPESSATRESPSSGYIQDAAPRGSGASDGSRVHVYGHYNVDDQSSVPPPPVQPQQASSRYGDNYGQQGAANARQETGAAPEIIYGRRMTPVAEQSQAHNPTGNPTHNGKYIIQK